MNAIKRFTICLQMDYQTLLQFAYKFSDKISDNLTEENDSIDELLVKNDIEFDGSVSLYDNSILFQKCLFLKHTPTTNVKPKLADDVNFMLSNEKKVIIVQNDGVFKPVIGSSCYVINWVTRGRINEGDYYFDLKESYVSNRIYANSLTGNSDNGTCLMYYNGAIQRITENSKRRIYFLKGDKFYLVDNDFKVKTENYENIKARKQVGKRRKIEIICQLLRKHLVSQGCYKIVPRVANNICAKWLPKSTKIETILRKIAKEHRTMYLWTLYECDIQDWRHYSLTEIQNLFEENM